MLRIEERCSLFLSSLLNIFLWEDGFSALQKETKVKNLIHFSPLRTQTKLSFQKNITDPNVNEIGFIDIEETDLAAYW